MAIGEDKVDVTKVGLVPLFLELGNWPEGSVLSEGDLANILGKNKVSIKRAIERGELPSPTRLMGQCVWTVGAIIKHIESRLQTEAERKESLDRTVSKFSSRQREGRS